MVRRVQAARTPRLPFGLLLGASWFLLALAGCTALLGQGGDRETELAGRAVIVEVETELLASGRPRHLLTLHWYPFGMDHAPWVLEKLPAGELEGTPSGWRPEEGMILLLVDRIRWEGGDAPSPSHRPESLGHEWRVLTIREP
jgi:hypothetical protein